MSECDIDRLHQIEKWIIEHLKQSFGFLFDKDTSFWWFLFMPTYYGVLHRFSIHPSEIWLKWQFYSSNRETTHFGIPFKFSHAIQFTWIDPISFTCIDIDSNGEPTTARQQTMEFFHYSNHSQSSSLIVFILINWVNRSCWFNQNRCIHFNSEQFQCNILNKKTNWIRLRFNYQVIHCGQWHHDIEHIYLQPN